MSLGAWTFGAHDAGLGPAAFLDFFPVVVGVLCALSGLGIVLMGLIAVAGRRPRRGGLGALAGLLLLALGLWLVGFLGT
ncbi:MAG: hypothetical protein ACC662_10825 [Planctomycetota bacterium]